MFNFMIIKSLLPPTLRDLQMIQVSFRKSKPFAWLHLRFSNCFEQNYPTFSRMILKLRQKEHFKEITKVLKIVEKYMQWLTAKVTDLQTIYS